MIKKENNEDIKNSPRLICSVIFVKDVEVSKNFYCNILQQKIKLDNGRNVEFEGGFSIWEEDYANKVIFSTNTEPSSGHKLELYFESMDIDNFFDRISQENVSIIHKIKTHPWQQRAFRILDPDNHILEIGEPISATIIRLFNEGKNIRDIEELTTLPVGYISEILNSLK